MSKFMRFLIMFAMIAPLNPALAIFVAGIFCQIKNEWDDVL